MRSAPGRALVGVATLLAAFGCSTSQTALPEQPTEVEICEFSSTPFFSTYSPAVDGDELRIEVGYEGCSSDVFRLCWGGTFGGDEGDTAALRIQRLAAGGCGSGQLRELRWSLLPLAEAHAEEEGEDAGTLALVGDVTLSYAYDLSAGGAGGGGASGDGSSADAGGSGPVERAAGGAGAAP